MLGNFSCIPNLCSCIKVYCPFKTLNQFQNNVQERKFQLLELALMDLLNKVKKIAMTRLSVLYNTNLVPIVIYVSPPLGEPEQ
jgi:hypothetical protein